MLRGSLQRTIVATAGACLFTLPTVPTHAQETSAPEPVHVGVLAPLSGPFEMLGRQVEAGVQRAIEQAEADGLAVRLTAVDDGCNESRGRDAANQLVGAGVDIVVGGVCWRPAVAARDVLAFEAIPFVASGVRYGPFTDDAGENVLRLNGRDDAEADAIVGAITDGTLDGLVGAAASARPLVMFYTDGSYGRTLGDAVEAGLASEGVALALREAFEPGDDLSRLASRARAEDAGLILVFAGQADSALLIDALAERLPNTPVLAGDSVMTSEFWLLADDGAPGVAFARPTPWRSLIDEAQVRALEGEEEGSLFGLVLPSLAATEVALALMAGETEPFDTVLGPIRFDAQGDVQVPSFQIWQWREGTIWPLEAPEAG